MTAQKSYDFTSFDDLEKESGEYNFTPFEPRETSEEKESKLKSFFRTLYQFGAGGLQAITYPLDILQMMAMGDALDPEEIDRIQAASERMGIPFDEEKYREAVQQAANIFPTQSNLEEFIEERTGAPLRPKTGLQKGLRLAGTAGKITPGSVTQKGVAAVTAPAVSKGLQEAGVPEPLAEIGGLGIGSATGAKVPGKGPAIEIKRKPSGLPERRYETLKEPRKISPKKYEQIQGKLENDFRKISNEIIEKSPISKTKASLEENPAFKSEVAQQFREVENLASEIPEVFPSKDIKKKFIDNALQKRTKGFALSEYEKDYKKFANRFLNDITKKEITTEDLVHQYRKNNKSLADAYDPGRSYAYNRAKKDVLLEANRTIADIIEEKFPNSEFSKLFKETNEQWTKIADAEAIDKFIEGMFEGKVQYGKGKKFFLNENQARPFKRALGEEKFKEFEQLMKDMLSTEKAAKMLKVAEKQGWKDLASTAGAYVIHPKYAKARFLSNQGKRLYKGLVDSLLDKPRLMLTWKNGVEALKKGNFSNAEKNFEKLKKETNKEKSN